MKKRKKTVKRKKKHSSKLLRAKWPWLQWRAEWIRTDPAAVRDLKDFARFVEHKVSRNTWANHTSDWHAARVAHQKSIASQALTVDKHRQAAILLRQQQTAQVLGNLSVKALMRKNKKTGAQELVPMSPKNSIALYSASQKVEQKVLELELKGEPVTPAVPGALMGVQVNVQQSGEYPRVEADLIAEIEGRLAGYLKSESKTG